MAEPKPGLLGHAIRYGLVGVANTALGLSVIFAVEFGLHASAILANACGYAAGIVLGFVLNRGFVFRSSAGVGRSGPRYLIAVAAAYLLNLAVLTSGHAVLPAGDLWKAASQIAALGAYTVTLFILSRYWVFGGSTIR